MLAEMGFSWYLNFRLFQHRVMGRSSSAKADTIGQDVRRGDRSMDYFAGLDTRLMRSPTFIASSLNTLA